MCAAAQALSMSTRYARVWHTGNTKEPLARILHYILLLRRQSCPIWGISERKHCLGGAELSPSYLF